MRLRGEPTGSGETLGTFELESFVWSAPDELEVVGRFTSVVPEEEPILVIYGSDGTHRLACVDDDAWSSGDGDVWGATFGWEEPPMPIESAELHVGKLVVELPGPGADAEEPLSIPLGSAADEPPEDPEPAPSRPDEPPPSRPDEPAERHRERADLAVAHEELAQARAAHAAAVEEVAHAVAQLEDERRGRAADSERFREDIDDLRAMAEQTIAAERRAAESLHAELSALRQDVELAEATAERLTEERDAALARVAEVNERGIQLRSQLSAAEDELADVRDACVRVGERLKSIATGADWG
jgi:hypothetical protein